MLVKKKEGSYRFCVDCRKLKNVKGKNCFPFPKIVTLDSLAGIGLFSIRNLGKEVVYLGHVVSPAGIFADPAKIEVTQNWPIPNDVSDVHFALGMFGYYLKFIRDDRKKAGSLTTLTEKSVDFVLGRSLAALKEDLIRAPILIPPDPKEQFILDIDTSG